MVHEGTRTRAVAHSGWTRVSGILESRKDVQTMADQVELKAGDEAPAIVAPITGGGTFDLSEHRGEWVAVYFYPRANTPG